MNLYRVPVFRKDSDEMMAVWTRADCRGDAVIRALRFAFRVWGWRACYSNVQWVQEQQEQRKDGAA